MQLTSLCAPPRRINELAFRPTTKEMLQYESENGNYVRLGNVRRRRRRGIRHLANAEMNVRACELDLLRI
jgi:hypothetical protein